MNQKTDNTLIDDCIIIFAEEGVLHGPTVAQDLPGFSGKGYVTDLNNDGDSVEVSFELPKQGYYELKIRYAATNGEKRNLLYINGDIYGEFISTPTKDFLEASLCVIHLHEGKNTIKIVKFWGDIDIDSFTLLPSEAPSIPKPTFQLVNKNTTPECVSLMNFFKSIYGKKIITGQHTAAASGPELDKIKEVTGKLPALRGFDLLSYSIATETDDPTDHKLMEIEENKGSIEKAIEWSTKHKGIVTFCWHWYSPTGGIDKTFYTKNTDFDLKLGLTHGTKEYKALLADMDEIAKQLKKLQAANVPVLWRPLHEADGKWFWWGAHGPEPYKKLYKWMYDRYTYIHGLNNLIWVWNAPNLDWYPGHDYVDIAGMDTYVPNGEYGSLTLLFNHTLSLVDKEKPVALTENGPIPDPDKLIATKTPWLWYMPWYGDFVFSGISTSFEQLKKVYNHPYCISLETLPDLNNYLG